MKCLNGNENDLLYFLSGEFGEFGTVFVFLLYLINFNSIVSRHNKLRHFEIVHVEFLYNEYQNVLPNWNFRGSISFDLSCLIEKQE